MNRLLGNCSEKNKIALLLLLAGIVLLIFGIMRGEMDTVFSKAVQICLECIGIG